MHEVSNVPTNVHNCAVPPGHLRSDIYGQSVRV